MAKKKSYKETRDKVLMNLCKKAARKRGLDPDEPSFKAYCTRLYNQTMQGKGLSDFASDRDAKENAERLNKVFKALGFCITVKADGQFIDFYTCDTNNYIDSDDVKARYYRQYGKEINFDDLISQFWASRPAIKTYVESLINAPSPTSTIPEAVPEQSTETKPSSNGGKVLGGLKYQVLSTNEAEQLSNKGYVVGFRVSRINGISGDQLIAKFGDPTDIFWPIEGKTFGYWRLKIADTGYFDIRDYRALTPSDTGNADRDSMNDYLSWKKNKLWSIAVVFHKSRTVMTDKECDHASHFFADSFFEGKVEFPFEGCDEVPAQQSTDVTPEPSPTTQADVPTVKRGRGRPKGSTNKPKPQTSSDTPKRPRGRPKGSGNKPKPAQSLPSTPTTSPATQSTDPLKNLFGQDIYERLKYDKQAVESVIFFIQHHPFNADRISDDDLVTIIEAMMS